MHKALTFFKEVLSAYVFVTFLPLLLTIELIFQVQIPYTQIYRTQGVSAAGVFNSTTSERMTLLRYVSLMAQVIGTSE